MEQRGKMVRLGLFFGYSEKTKGEKTLRKISKLKPKAQKVCTFLKKKIRRFLCEKLQVL